VAHASDGWSAPWSAGRPTVGPRLGTTAKTCLRRQIFRALASVVGHVGGRAGCLRRQVSAVVVVERSGYRAPMATDDLRDLENEAWSGFLYTHDRLWRTLEAGLAELNVSMGEYSVMALLYAAGPKGMRMTDLAKRRVMSTGGFTRLADRLERRGLIERRPSAVDGRSFEATLTPKGRALMRKARRRHHSDLRALFFDRLDDDQLRCLTRIWADLDPSADTSRGEDARADVEQRCGPEQDGRAASRPGCP